MRMLNVEIFVLKNVKQYFAVSCAEEFQEITDREKQN